MENVVYFVVFVLLRLCALVFGKKSLFFKKGLLISSTSEENSPSLEQWISAVRQKS